MAVNHEVDVGVSGSLAQAVTARAEQIFGAA
jgi:DNA repair ATPase RecN